MLLYQFSVSYILWFRHLFACYFQKLHVMEFKIHETEAETETQLVESCSFPIGRSEVKMVDWSQIFRMQIDKHLAWDRDTPFVRSKIPRAIGLLKYAKLLLPSETLCKMYRGRRRRMVPCQILTLAVTA